jgi:hypothetical protein
MNRQNIKSIHRVTALILLAAILFYLFFQVNKAAPFVETNPFANDPYDAVGSFAFQVALLVSLLTYARMIRWRDDPAQDKGRLILHGNLLALVTILITLCTDTIADIAVPVPPSFWGNILHLELGLMFILTLGCGLLLWMVFRHLPTEPPPTNLTPADAIDDMWSLVRVPVLKAAKILPGRLVGWVKHFNSDLLFAHLVWVDPRQHPWRFTCGVGLLVGVLIWLAGFQEGLPPSFGIALLLAGIHISGEFFATLVGFAVFGGYLGLRPIFREKG